MGMLSFDITCPHCLRENAVLTGFGEHERSNTVAYDVAFYCRSCEMPAIAVVRPVDGNGSGPGPLDTVRRYKGNNLISFTDSLCTDFILEDVIPRSQVYTAPENSPPKAAASYVEARENIQRGHYETAVILCRKTLDISTRNLLGDDAQNESLFRRISTLHDKGLITNQMKDWAHIVREESNSAVHSEEEFTEEEVKELIAFTEVFLLYAFTLPAMVSKTKSKPRI